MPFLHGLALASILAAAAWRAGALTRGGALAAAAVGAAILSATGWEGGLVLAVFFVPSTLLGRLSRGRPAAIDSKGEQRDAVQVLANGGAAAVGALLEFLSPGPGLWIVTCSLAAAGGDTWATAIGSWSRSDPRLLLTGRPVPPGTSGGVSLVGTLGALAGSLAVAGAGFVSEGDSLLLVGTIIGFVGMLLDSALGAGLQGRFQCPACGAGSERRVHACGSKTEWVGGWRWLDNDGVNALTTGFAALAGGLAWWWLA